MWNLLVTYSLHRWILEGKKEDKSHFLKQGNTVYSSWPTTKVSQGCLIEALAVETPNQQVTSYPAQKTFNLPY